MNLSRFFILRKVIPISENYFVLYESYFPVWPDFLLTNFQSLLCHSWLVLRPTRKRVNTCKCTKVIITIFFIFDSHYTTDFIVSLSSHESFQLILKDEVHMVVVNVMGSPGGSGTSSLANMKEKIVRTLSRNCRILFESKI